MLIIPDDENKKINVILWDEAALDFGKSKLLTQKNFSKKYDKIRLSNSGVNK